MACYVYITCKLIFNMQTRRRTEGRGVGLHCLFVWLIMAICSYSKALMMGLVSVHRSRRSEGDEGTQDAGLDALNDLSRSLSIHSWICSCRTRLVVI